MVGLIILFSFSVAASLLWLISVFFYIYAKIGFPQLFGMPLPDVVMIAATAFLPVIFLWMVVAQIYNAMTLRKQENTINLLLTQTRRSADHAEAMVRTLMETQMQTRSTLVLHNADLFISELNDLLADFVVRFGLIQPAHTELIWQRVGDGNRWAFCKVVLQNTDNSPKFNEDLKNQLLRDEILSKNVRTFCYRFEQMFTMLERHDFEHYLTKIFEEGSLGRVYLKFVEVCREIDREQNASQSLFDQPPEPEKIFSDEEDETFDSVPSVDQEYRAQSVYNPQPAEEPCAPLQEAPVPAADTEKEYGATGSPFGFLRPTR